MDILFIVFSIFAICFLFYFIGRSFLPALFSSKLSTILGILIICGLVSLFVEAGFYVYSLLKPEEPENPEIEYYRNYRSMDDSTFNRIHDSIRNSQMEQDPYYSREEYK